MAKLLIDMDEVVAGLNVRCCELWNKDHPDDLMSISRLTSWKINGELFRPYFSRPGFCRDLPVLENSQECIAELADRHDVWFVTSPPSLFSVQDKLLWAEDNFPVIGWKKTIPCKNKGMVRGHLLFDDSPEFLETVSMEGDPDMLRVVKSMPYNLELSAAFFDYRVADWNSFMILIADLERRGLL